MDGKLFINKEQAEIVKRIFSEALDGKGTQKIADGLNSDKIPTKRGSHWTATTIRGILSNEKYTGDVLLQKPIQMRILSGIIIVGKNINT